MPSRRGSLIAWLACVPLSASFGSSALAQSSAMIEAAREIQNELVEMVTANPNFAESGPQAFQKFSEAVKPFGGEDESAMHGLYLRTLYGKPIVDFLLRLAQYPTVAEGTIVDRDAAFSSMVRELVLEAGLLGFEAKVLLGEIPHPTREGETVEDKVLLQVSPKLEDGVRPVAAFHAHLDVVGISERTNWVFSPYPPKVIACDRGSRFPVTASQIRELVAANPDLDGRLSGLQGSFEVRSENTFESGHLFETWEALAPEGPLLYGRGVAEKASVALLLYSLRAIADMQLGGNAVLYVSLGRHDPRRWEGATRTLKAPDMQLPLANFVADFGGMVSAEPGIGGLVVTFEEKKKAGKPKANTFVIVDFHSKDSNGTENAADRVPASATASVQSGSWLRAPAPEALQRALVTLRASVEEYEQQHLKEHGPTHGGLIHVSEGAEDGVITINVRGVAAHGMNSDSEGHNAVKDLACFLNTLDLSPNLFSQVTRFVERAFGSHGARAEPLGLKAGSAFCGRPGLANLSRLVADRDGDNTKIDLLVDLRYPDSVSPQVLEKKLRKAIRKITKAGCDLTDIHGLAIGYVHREGVSRLMGEAKRIGLQSFGVEFQADCSYGSTYARMLNTADDRKIGRYALAMGPWPDTEVGKEELGSHGFNENVSTDMLMRGGVFYTTFISEVVRGMVDLGVK